MRGDWRVGVGEAVSEAVGSAMKGLQREISDIQKEQKATRGAMTNLNANWSRLQSRSEASPALDGVQFHFHHPLAGTEGRLEVLGGGSNLMHCPISGADARPIRDEVRGRWADVRLTVLSEP